MRKIVLVFLLVCALQATVGAQPPCVFPPEEGADNIVILRVQYAATVLNDEFIVLFNKGKTTVDLSGWVIFDSQYEEYRHLSPPERPELIVLDHLYKIPYGFELKPHYWVRICTGRGKNDEIFLYLNRDNQWLNDDGGILYLMDDTCNLIDEYSWP